MTSELDKDVSSTLIFQDASDGAKHPTREYIDKSEAGRTRSGAIWIPEEIKSDALIAFGHGASGDRYQAPIPYLAGKFVKQGYVVLSIDGPVHGLRKVGGGDRQAFGAEMQRETMMDDMNADWRFGLSIVDTVVPSRLNRLGYFGLSMGTIFGIPFLADTERPLELTAATLGLLGSQGLGIRWGERLLNDAKRISCPTLFLMQLEDELFSRDGYLALFDAIGSEDKRLHANPGLHAAVPTEEVRFSFEFMTKTIES